MEAEEAKQMNMYTRLRLYRILEDTWFAREVDGHAKVQQHHRREELIAEDLKSSSLHAATVTHSLMKSRPILMFIVRSLAL